MKKCRLVFLVGVLLLTACGVAEDDPADEPSIPVPSTEETPTTRVSNSSDSDLTTDSVEESDTNQADQDVGDQDSSESIVPPTTEYEPPTTKDGLPDHPEPSIPPPRD